MELTAVPVVLPEPSNVILGQAHFIKTIVDLHETLAAAPPSLRFIAAFREASGPRLVRRSGNDDELTAADVTAAHASGTVTASSYSSATGFPSTY